MMSGEADGNVVAASGKGKKPGGDRSTILVVVLLLVGMFVFKTLCPCGPPRGGAVSANPQRHHAPESRPPTPGLVYLGSSLRCEPCVLMEPVVARLNSGEFGGMFAFESHDLARYADIGGHYGVDLVPYTIFHDANGGELLRQPGFMDVDTILKLWKSLGYEFKPEKEESPDDES